MQTILMKELVPVYSLYCVCVQRVLMEELVLVYSVYRVCVLCVTQVMIHPKTLPSLPATPLTLY